MFSNLLLMIIGNIFKLNKTTAEIIKFSDCGIYALCEVRNSEGTKIGNFCLNIQGVKPDEILL